MCSCTPKNKKNAEHTRMYTNFRSFLSQYSRRLLSILAQHPQQRTRQRKWCECCLLVRWIVGASLYSPHCIKAKHKKKCGAHTHVRQLSQLSSQYSRWLLSILAQLSQTNNHYIVRRSSTYIIKTPRSFINKHNNQLSNSFLSQRYSPNFRKEMLIIFSYASRGYCFV